jgi:predicted dienelactone hydrolase
MFRRWKTLTAISILLLILGDASHAAVGFQQLTVPDPEGKPLAVGTWYPSRGPIADLPVGQFRQAVVLDGPVLGSKLPLVLISHGTGGGLASHYDTALALANAGFVVAAVTHTGDNYADQSYAGNRVDLTDRSRQIRRVLDFLLKEWSQHQQVDATKIGIFGFSLGGFTALVEAGGTPDLTLMAQLCSSKPGAPECSFIQQRKGDQLKPSTTPPVWIHDPHIKAAVIAAPAASYLFAAGGLRQVRIPVQLWRAENDEQAPNAWNSDIVAQGIPQLAEEHTVPRAGHFVFLAPCSEVLASQAPQICGDAPGVDRLEFHRQFNQSVVAFFRAALGYHPNSARNSVLLRSLQALET